eukprot:Awhi_evm1s8010
MKNSIQIFNVSGEVVAIFGKNATSNNWSLRYDSSINQNISFSIAPENNKTHGGKCNFKVVKESSPSLAKTSLITLPSASPKNVQLNSSSNSYFKQPVPNPKSKSQHLESPLGPSALTSPLQLHLKSSSLSWNSFSIKRQNVPSSPKDRMECDDNLSNNYTTGHGRLLARLDYDVQLSDWDTLKTPLVNN